MLADEVRTWPGVTQRPMFGMLGLYRGKKMFAALPKSKAMGQNSLIFKLEPLPPALKAKLEADPRVNTSEARRWFPFELVEESDLRGALEWLQLAYQNAPKLPGSKNR